MNIQFFQDISTGNKLAARLAIVPFIWLPIIAGHLLKEDKGYSLIYYCFFVVIYIMMLAMLYLFLKKITKGKKNKSFEIALGCYLLLIVQNLVIVYLYIHQIMQTLSSLWIGILISLFSITICAFAIKRTV
ncbi:hypothetical protein EV202_10129 [Bacteroides heparinolyticus]|uniref:Transmembrane protein n=1 Tax=Prevotella heparinolytica TaxID=28113 RepID=A0A4R2LRY2_9BACE|nr:hypothetical protein [Bacteroides heparinolyticus]TCO96260.1 hypothetical protein EV202_10129 [Bacteroides heparinolyticus]